MYMTRVSGLPEPRHKSQLCFTIRKVICGSWLRRAGALTPEINAEHNVLGKTSSHLVPQWHRGLRVYVYTWSIGDLWSKRSMSGRVA